MRQGTGTQMQGVAAAVAHSSQHQQSATSLHIFHTAKNSSVIFIQGRSANRGAAVTHPHRRHSRAAGCQSHRTANPAHTCSTQAGFQGRVSRHGLRAGFRRRGQGMSGCAAHAGRLAGAGCSQTLHRLRRRGCCRHACKRRQQCQKSRLKKTFRQASL